MVDDDTEYHWRVETFRFVMPCGLVIPVIFGFSKFAKSDGLECGLVNYFAGEIQSFCTFNSRWKETYYMYTRRMPAYNAFRRLCFCGEVRSKEEKLYMYMECSNQRAIYRFRVRHNVKDALGLLLLVFDYIITPCWKARGCSGKFGIVCSENAGL